MKISFEKGLFELCRKRIAEEGEVLEKVDYQRFQEYRKDKLRQTLRHVNENSRFYQKQFEQCGLAPEDIKDFDELQQLPFTFPEDIRTNGYEFLCISQRNVERPVTFYSSGTTGFKKRLFFSTKDVIHIMEFIAMAMNSIVNSKDTRILSLMTNSQGRGASDLYARSVRMTGMEAVVADIQNASKELLELSIRANCNVWFGDITTIYRLAKEMEQEINLDPLGMKLLFVTMGNISIPVKNYLETLFQCPVITHYGLTEVGWGFAIDCEEGNGYDSNELDVYTEIIDPQTGIRLPDGEVGELTYTLIGREAMPLIRYRCGDLAYKISSNEDRHLDIIGPIVRRIEGSIEIKEGHWIYPAMLEEILYTHQEVVDYRPYIDGNRLIIYVEIYREQKGVAKQLEDDLMKNADIQLMAPPRIIVVPSDTLKKFCYEKKQIKEWEMAGEIW